MIARVVTLFFASWSAHAIEVTFPEDGWYQLQDKITHVEVCNSDRQCDVAAGVYKLINHTTGSIDYNYVVSGTESSTSVEFTRSFISCNTAPVSGCSNSCPVNTNLLTASCEAFDWNSGTTKIEYLLAESDGRVDCTTIAGRDARFNITLLCVNAPVNLIANSESIVLP